MRVFLVMVPDNDGSGLMLASDEAAAVHRSLRRAGLAKAERERILAAGHARALECRPSRVRMNGKAQAKFLPEQFAESEALPELLGQSVTVEPCPEVEAFAALPDETLMRLCRATFPGRKAKVRVLAVAERFRAGRTRRPASSATRLQAVYALSLALLEPGFAEAA